MDISDQITKQLTVEQIITHSNLKITFISSIVKGL